MPEQLLERQVRLLKHLTSGAVIFGTQSGDSARCGLDGINGGLLHLEARFSHEKRMGKIEWVLTRTLELLGTNKSQIIRDFAQTCPPVSISRLENAGQMYQFLLARWSYEPPEPPYLPDIALLELAYARVRSGERPGQAEEDRSSVPRGAVRRHPRVVLVHSAYDIRPIFEGNSGEPTRRDTWFAVAMPVGNREPIISELSPNVFALLEMLDEFADEATFRNSPEIEEVTSDLAARGLLEVRG